MQNSDKNRFPDLLTLMKSWIPGIKMEGDTSNPNPNPNHSPNPSSRNFPRDFWMPDQSCRVCYDCDSQFNLINRRHHCRLCGRVFCSKCTSFIPLHPKIELIEGGERIRVCNYCLKQWEEAVKGRNGKNAVPDSPVLSPSVSSASLASSCTGQTSSSLTGGTCSNQNYDCAPGDYMRFDQAAMIPSEIHVVKDVPNVVANNCEHYQFCMNRSDDDDDDSSYSPSDSETLKCRNSADFSNIPNFPNIPDSYSQPDKPPLSISPTQNPNPKPLSPVHSESASSFTFTSDETRSYSGDESTATSSHLYGIERIDENLVDVENNQLLWVPPEAADGEEESEEGEGEDEDSVGPTGDWGYQRSNSFGVGLYRNRERSAEEHKKVMKNVVDGHFKALITQLLQVENISIEGKEGGESWLDIITRLAWEAASLLKPDMSKGGGMDPGGYVKVKCIASGCCTDSAVIKGVVCKKNVAHRRMKPEIKKPRILILGGALEYQRVSNLLSSFDTLLQQEMEYLRMAVAKIQAHKPNILLVEKAVSRSAQDLFLDRNISLVLNIKRPLLERISRCTGAQIVPSIDHLSNPKLGNCELFHVEKFLEKHEGGKQVLKTLMFFEDCPKPLGCTILLKGASSDELKRVKHVVQYGVFAAYHLALETSFLADEGATLPELPLKTPLIVSLPEKHSVIERSISLFNPSPTPQPNTDPLKTANSVDSSIFGFLSDSFLSTQATAEKGGNNKVIEKKHDDGRLNVDVSGAIRERFGQNEDDLLPSPSDPQSILVSLSSRCDWKKTVCENPRLLRITYYGSADKPLGRFLREQLFNQSYACHSCDMPSEAHVYCYTHRLGCLTISVRKLPEAYLQGESSGKIWMWHRCLKCPHVNKLPPANKRVVMSDAAWGLSFGKFLELSFSNHASASRVASCGHSLHRDCLRFYGFGRMVACFRYAPIKVHNVYLPPSKLDFAFWHQDWVAKEAREVADFVEQTFKEISNALQKVTDKRLSTGSLDGNGKLLESWRIFTELDMILQSEKVQFKELVQRLTKKETKKGEPIIDILEVNKLRMQLIFLSYIWDRRLIFASNTIKEKGESTNNLVNSNIDDVNRENTTMNGFKRVLSDGQFPIITDLSDTLDAKWRGENGKNLPEEVTTQTDVLLCTSKDPSKNWYKKEFSVLDDSLIKNLKLASLDVLGEYNPNYLPVFRDLARYNGARLLLPIGFTGTVIPVFDDEPTSIISYVLASQDYHSQLSEQPVKVKEVGSINPSDPFQLTDDFSSENIGISSSGDIRVSFEGNGFLGKVKYTVLCYYAKCFEALRKKCCPSEVDFVRSLSRCKKWGAQGGKSNVFFAKSLDDRFIIKQVTKTELESFLKFAPEYFKYLSESIGTKSPTCLAKILGIYQVSTKHVKGGKESKMDLLVMENLLFRRNVTRLYDLKGSSRSRYNSDQSGNNKVLLDQNLIEMMPTCPIFVGKDAKRILERAIWNDTAFLASIDVMDYSLLVGVDEERHELVLGIIDFVRQYTWDKHLETWAKSSGILGGSKNASPTVISPNLYKKRFRKAMSTYFIVVPDQWRPSGIVPNKSFSELNQDSQGALEET